MLIDFDIAHDLGRVVTRQRLQAITKAMTGKDYMPKEHMQDCYTVKCEAKAAIALVMGG